MARLDLSQQETKWGMWLALISCCIGGLPGCQEITLERKILNKFFGVFINSHLLLQIQIQLEKNYKTIKSSP